MFARATLSTLALVLVAGLSAGPACAQDKEDKGPQPIALGSKAPLADVRMMNVDGRQISIAGAAGNKGTLVIFSCNACPWVKRWEDRIAKVGNDAVKRGVGVIMINPNDPSLSPEDSFDVMKKRTREKGFKFAYVVDATSEVARAFGASRTPEAFLFDAGGRLVYHGTIDDNAADAAKVESPYLADAVAAVASGRPVGTAQTKALGCTIKFRKAKDAS